MTTIELKQWQAEKERLTAHKDSLFQQVKDMRGDIALLENICKSNKGISGGRIPIAEERE